MKTLPAAVVMLLATGAPAHAALDTLAGYWEGAYVRMNSVQVLHLDLVWDGAALGGTVSIPEMALVREPIRSAGGTVDSLSLAIPYGTFTLRLSPDGRELTGTNDRWNPPLALHLKRAERPRSAGWPEAPVTFRNGGVTLEGTLLRPAPEGRHPAVVIVHGSGAQGRTSNFYAVWGDLFARNGVAALIYDKRGVGASSGDLDRASFDDLAGDIRAAVAALSRHPDVDPGRIGLFGMSQGGWLAPLAARGDPRVAFMILDVGPAVSVRDQELHRVAYTMRNEDADTASVDSALAYMRAVFDAAYDRRAVGALLARADQVAAAPWSGAIEVIRSEADLDGWARLRYDPSGTLAGTRTPLLALYGEHDTLVPPAENVEPLRRLLTRAGNPDFEIRVIPGVGHDMVTFGRLEGGEWKWPGKYWVWARRSPELEPAIVGWLRQRGFAP